MKERIFTITRPTGFQVQVRAASQAQLWDALVIHSWPPQHAEEDAADAWQHLCPLLREGFRGEWSVAHA